MGVDWALINGFDTMDCIIPAVSIPHKGKKTLHSYPNRRVYRFDNGYGASVIPDRFDGMEVFLVKFTGPDIDDFDLCHDGSPVCDKWNGYHNVKSENTLQICLKHIRALNKSGNYSGCVKPKGRIGRYI